MKVLHNHFISEPGGSLAQMLVGVLVGALGVPSPSGMFLLLAWKTENIHHLLSERLAEGKKM